jgi:hypothetical protein
MAGKIPRTIFRLVEPAVWGLAARLLILTTDRKGSSKAKPSVSTFYETGIVTSLYEAMLMSAVLSNYDIRHEESYRSSKAGAPKRVDLWLRPVKGGTPIAIEAGDFSAPKIHRDLAKLKKLNPTGTNWFLAFFRKEPDNRDPLSAIKKSLALPSSGLDSSVLKIDDLLVGSFDVFRPNGVPDKFGVALIRGR